MMKRPEWEVRPVAADPIRPAGDLGARVLAGGQLDLALAVGAGERVRAVLRGEVDLYDAERLTESPVTIARACPDGVDVDLSEVAFLDCAGLSALQEAQAEATAQGWSLVLRHPSPAVARLTRLVCLPPFD
ncbi:STAS domain-containing protein [Kitasatospora sp. NPDC088346]|uniref:STAS domain-containing protein n=1 Tax=Kitasatospora sp. NPDC088346 TaxID=3364073 RepID=UPI0037FDBCD4